MLITSEIPTPEALLRWYLNQSLPLWARYGVDRQYGGFFEKLQLDLTPKTEHRRSRLVARQIYWFAASGSFGWQGSVDELIQHGYQYLSQYLVTPVGQVYATCDPSGRIQDDRQLLYDVAFVLVALAKLAQRFPNHADYEALARRIVIRLSPHPLGGYIDVATPELQCANPHMHLFEAFLAWTTLTPPSDCFWRHRAAALADLATRRLIQPRTGLVPEHFDHTWRPISTGGSLRIEPGHQFEWSWLLSYWSMISGDVIAANAASRLCSLAEEHGVHSGRQVTIECINEHFQPCDLTARLWQQTERLKAWYFQDTVGGLPNTKWHLSLALNSLFGFISGPYPGLWFDEMDSSGSFVSQTVKASSGYHIASAIEVLFDRFFPLIAPI
jgi:mannose-6-phosphate isomerase